MMKFIICLIFSFGLLYFNMNKFYLICFFLSFLMFMDIELFFNLWVKIYMIFSLDYYSMYLVILTLWIIGIMMMLELKLLSKVLILLLLIILILSFSTFNLLMFYILFEASLLPIFLLIKFNGYTFERFEAMMYMYFYTMISSMPFFIIMMILDNSYYTLMFFVLEMMNIKMELMLFILMLMVFLVKMPMFMMHLWLPKAHVEAPVYGSMILAGVLLKLGSYGILRLNQFFFYSVIQLMNYLISLCLIGGVILSLICLIQIDLKMLVAYSSVVHMNLLICSLSSLTKMGLIGSYMMMIGHGLCSSALFYIVNVNYERTLSRLLLMNMGGVNLNSTLSMWWFLLCISNFSAPISLSLIGEILMIMSLISLDMFLMLYLMMMCFLSAVYSLYLFSFSQHGVCNLMYMEYKEVTVKDYLIFFIHWFPLNSLIFCLNMFMI